MSTPPSVDRVAEQLSAEVLSTCRVPPSAQRERTRGEAARASASERVGALGRPRLQWRLVRSGEPLARRDLGTRDYRADLSRGRYTEARGWLRRGSPLRV